MNRNSSQSALRHSRHFQAFTLLELLIAIVIIAVLAILTLSLSGPVMMRTRTVQDVNNLKSIALATRLYANDNSGSVPVYYGTSDGITEGPTQTWGMDAGRTCPARCLYAPGSLPGGTHPMGGGDYVKSTKVFYSPHLNKSLLAKVREGTLLMGDNGRYRIGYFLYSLPQSTPAIYKGTEMANDNLLRWGRTPLYSDEWRAQAVTDGFSGDHLGVAHLDGGVSLRPFKLATQVLDQAGYSAFLYYLSTGEIK